MAPQAAGNLKTWQYGNGQTTKGIEIRQVHSPKFNYGSLNIAGLDSNMSMRHKNHKFKVLK